MPGEPIEVEARDEVSDSVRLKGRADQRITIGMRAASKVQGVGERDQLARVMRDPRALRDASVELLRAEAIRRQHERAAGGRGRVASAGESPTITDGPSARLHQGAQARRDRACGRTASRRR